MDTGAIAAVATGPAGGPVGIIRISGPGLFDRPWPYIRPLDKQPLDATRDRRAFVARLYHGEELLDTVVVTCFKSPHSYTGEDVIELGLHGNRLLLSDCLEVLFADGIRPAAPGEFTKRAFLNGKLDLSQAEAVQSLVSAANRFALEKSRQNLNGYISRENSKLRSYIINLKADIEAELDFMDQDITFSENSQLISAIDELTDLLERLLASSRRGDLFSDGIWLVISGPPNAGKSTLLNLLLGYERSIVSESAGTTRDYIKETLHIGGQLFYIYDTAGIRSGDIHHVEQAGIERARELKEKANLDLDMCDITALEAGEFEDLAARVKQAAVSQANLSAGSAGSVDDEKGIIRVAVYNKCDRLESFKSSNLKENSLYRLSEKSYCIFSSLVHTRQAQEQFVAALEHLAAEHFSGDDGILLSGRIRQLYEEALNELQAARQRLAAGELLEIVCTHINEALECVGRVTGEVDTEEILGRVFSRFCIGK